MALKNSLIFLFPSVKLCTLRQLKSNSISSQYSAMSVLPSVSNVGNAAGMVLLNICTVYFTAITENGVHGLILVRLLIHFLIDLGIPNYMLPKWILSVIPHVPGAASWSWMVQTIPCCLNKVCSVCKEIDETWECKWISCSIAYIFRFVHLILRVVERIFCLVLLHEMPLLPPTSYISFLTN